MLEAPGKYKCQVVDTKLEAQGERKGPQIVVKIKLVAKVNADGTQEVIADDIYRTVWYTLTDKTAERVAKDLAFLHFYGNPSQIDPQDPNFIDISGHITDWYMTHNTYNGKTNERWNVDRPRESAPTKPMDLSAKMSMDAQFGSYFKAAMPAAGTPATPPVSAPTAPQAYAAPPQPPVQSAPQVQPPVPQPAAPPQQPYQAPPAQVNDNDDVPF